MKAFFTIAVLAVGSQQVEAASVADDPYTGTAPVCEVDSLGFTHVFYTEGLHPSFKCTHSGSTCSCTAKHPTHHQGGCKQLENSAGKLLDAGGDCADSGKNPPPYVEWTDKMCMMTAANGTVGKGWPGYKSRFDLGPAPAGCLYDNGPGFAASTRQTSGDVEVSYHCTGGGTPGLHGNGAMMVLTENTNSRPTPYTHASVWNSNSCGMYCNAHPKPGMLGAWKLLFWGMTPENYFFPSDTLKLKKVGKTVSYWKNGVLLGECMQELSGQVRADTWTAYVGVHADLGWEYSAGSNQPPYSFTDVKWVEQ